MRVVAALLLVAGCASGPTIRVEEPIRPDVRVLPEVDESGVSERQFQPDPLLQVDKALRHDREADRRLLAGKDDPAKPTAAKGAQDKDPRLVISEAQAAGTNVPEEGDCEGGLCKYRFRKGEEYLVYGCWRTDVLIELAPGEKYQDDQRKFIAPGWRHERTEAGDTRGNIVEVIVLRQKTDSPGVQKAWFTTNVGTYYLRLEAADPDEGRCMRGLTFMHPQRELKRLMADAERSAERETDASPASMLTAQYTIQVIEGSPSWVPTAVIGQMTGDRAGVVIQFPPSVAWSSSPTIKTDGGVNDCRWIPETHTIACDNLFRKAVVKMGSEATGYERVLIRKARE
jgi:type IV secretory pathway VirB9-like protein